MLTRRRILALLGFAPVAAPAAIRGALRPSAPVVVAGLDVGAEGMALSVCTRDVFRGTVRMIASAHGLSWEEITRDLDEAQRSRDSLRFRVADEFDPYPPLPAGTIRAAVPRPMTGVSSQDLAGAFGLRPPSGGDS